MTKTEVELKYRPEPGKPPKDRADAVEIVRDATSQGKTALAEVTRNDSELQAARNAMTAQTLEQRRRAESMLARGYSAAAAHRLVYHTLRRTAIQALTQSVQAT